MADTQLTRAEFFGTPVSVLDHAGRQWLTAEQAGLCLGYNPANARQGVLKIFERHQDEFTTEDTCVVKLTSQGQTRDIRIFSATGCNLLGFFTNTPRAKDFRVWAKQFLADQAPTPTPAPAAPADARLDRIDANISTLAAGMSTVLMQLDVTKKYIGLLEINQTSKRRITPEIAAEAKALAAEGMNFADIGRLLRISRTSVSLLVRDLYPQHRLEAPALLQPSVGEILDGWIEREQAKLVDTLTKMEG